MGDWVAQDPEANRRFPLRLPVFQINERVRFFHVFRDSASRSGGLKPPVFGRRFQTLLLGFAARCIRLLLSHENDDAEREHARPSF